MDNRDPIFTGTSMSRPPVIHSVSSCPFLLVAIIQISFAFPVPAMNMESFYKPQDSFSYRRIDEQSGLLSAKFNERRGRGTPFTLVLPTDVSIEWKLIGGRAIIAGKESVLSGHDILDMTSLLQEYRYWLSDIPLAAFHFQKVDKASIFRAESDETVAGVLKEATFELRFSRPFGNIIRTEVNDPSPVEDAFADVAKTFIANPQDLPGCRRLPDTYEIPSKEGSTTDKTPGYLDLPVGHAVALRTSGSGIVSLTGGTLVEAGFDIRAKEPAFLELYHLGSPYPVAVECADSNRLGEEDTIWFHATPPGNGQGILNAFYLAWSEHAGMRIPVSDSAPWETESEGVRDWCWKTFHAEENIPDFYEHKKGIAGRIDVYWHEFQEIDERLVKDFDLEDLRTDLAEESDVSVRIRSLLPATIREQWAFSVHINGVTAAVFPLSHDVQVFEARMDGGLLRPFANRLEIVLTRQLPGFNNKNSGPSLDWIEMDYPAVPLIPNSGTVHGSRVESGTPGSPLAAWKTGSSGGAWRALIQNASPSEDLIAYRLERQQDHLIAPAQGWPADWWVFDLDKAAGPQSIEPVKTSNLKDSTVQADLLVITVPRFVPLLEDYLRFYQEEGWTYKIVTTQEIYEHFSYGVKETFAIREYCRFALYHYARPRPQFLWLVGESRWDPEGKLPSPIEDLVPSAVIGKSSDPVGDDQWYAYLVGEDAFPDLLVSRVSVSTTPELKAYLNKASQERTASLGWWRTRDLILADDQYSQDIEHYLLVDLAEHLFPSLVRVADYPLDTRRQFEAAGKPGHQARGARPDVIKAWSDGTRMVEYVGHGGITVWSHETLFLGLDRPDSDVDRLTNTGRYPFVMVRSCLSGSTNWPTPPGHVSLAEALIKAPDRGAIAVLGPSGREVSPPQEEYDNRVRSALFNHPLERLAAIRAYAHCQFLLNSPRNIAVGGAKMLHGDPLMRISVPERIDITECRWKSTEEGPGLALGWECPFTGNGQMRITSNYETVYESTPFSLIAGEGSESWALPISVPFEKDLIAALYIWNDETGLDAFRGIQLPEFDWHEENPIGQYDSWIPDAEPPMIQVGEIEIEYATPVAGETIAFSVLLTNDGGQPVRISSATAQYRISSTALPELAHPPRKQMKDVPFYLSNQNPHGLQWFTGIVEEACTIELEVFIETTDEKVFRKRVVKVRKPPELLVDSLRPRVDRISYAKGEEVECLLTIHNIGELDTDPLTLMGREQNQNQSFQVEVAPLAPGESRDATFTMAADLSRPSWAIVLDRQPAVRMERTKWKEQLNDFEWDLEWDLTADLEHGAWSRLDRDRGQLAVYKTRLLELTDTGLRPTKDSYRQELTVTNLEYPEPDQIRSATYAPAAAWQKGVTGRNWWISPFQMQAHPAWGGSRVGVRLPWEGDRIEALVSPSYHKHNNWQGLGYPMPMFRMDNPAALFEVTPNNTNTEGSFPAKRIEISKPGFDWKVNGSAGYWPGFAGMKFIPLPEVRTPVLLLPEGGEWNPTLEVEWVPHPPKEYFLEARTLSKDEKWNLWEPLVPNQALPGGRCQLRCLFIPEDPTDQLVLRSINVSVESIN